jgi:hypothetical protein
VENERKRANSLSKSKYLRFKFCAKALWLDKNMPHLAPPVDEKVQLAIKAGQEVDKLAKNLFENTVSAVVLNEAGGLDIPAMLAKTKELLNDKTVDVIAEAAFSFNGCYTAVDLLKRTDAGFEIYEVKSSTVLKERYIADLAYQHYVLTNCGLSIQNCFVVLLNSNYVRCAELDISELFKTRNIVENKNNELAYENALAVVGSEIESAKTALHGDEPQIKTHQNCLDCGYKNHCLTGLPTPSIFDLHGLRKKAFSHYHKGVVSYKDALENLPLNEKQTKQITAHLNNEPLHIDKCGVGEFLNSLWYPLYFLDFETFQTAIPLYEGTKPYQQIPFQYSLHYVKEKGGQLEHKEYLAEHGSDPREELALRLVEDIPLDACILAYNEDIEKNVILKLALLYPKLQEHLTKIAQNVRDLMVPFDKGYVYDKAMNGSFSLKSVLPAMFPNNPQFNYQNLAGVHNGAEAQVTFLKLPTFSKEECERQREFLLAYCKLDTAAMANIWLRLTELMTETC